MDQTSFDQERKFIRTAILHDFGRDVGEITEIYHDHKQNDVFLSESAVLRLWKEGQSRFATETWGYQQLHKHAIPAPQVLGFNERPFTLNHPALLLTRVPGTTVCKAAIAEEKKLLLFEQMGALLRKMHMIRIQGFGFLHIEDGEAVGQATSWNDHWNIEYTIPHIEVLKREGIITPDESTLADRAFSQVKQITLDKASLLHHDIHWNNVITDGESITGIIDLSNSMAGDPHYDIAISLFFQYPNQRDAFKSGYGTIAYEQEVSLYLLIVSFLKISWRFEQGAKDGVARALARFREVKKEVSL